MMMLYRLALEAYFHIRPMRIKELLVGTKAWEDYWVKRKRGSDWHYKSHDWVEGYWESINHPHRKLLVDAVSKFEPRSILEIGCACAPNLYLLALEYPKAKLWGIDINAYAIRYGQWMFSNEGIDNVKLFTSRLGKELLKDIVFDVIISDAVLIYIGKDRIFDVMENMINHFPSGMVLVERHMDGVGPLGVYKDGLWQRDYRELIARVAPAANIKITPIQKDIWEEWSETGCIIEVTL